MNLPMVRKCIRFSSHSFQFLEILALVATLQVNVSYTFHFSSMLYPLAVQLPFAGPFSPLKRAPLLPQIKCEKDDKQSPIEHISVERYPYHSYMDSTSGQLEPASGARASIPGEEYWPEGTSSRVRAARAPEPTGVSTGKPSLGKNPGSRRKRNKSSFAASQSSETNEVVNDQVDVESQEDLLDEPKDHSNGYVVYQAEPTGDELSSYELAKKIGNPHPFVDPEAKKPIEDPLTSEELWWNWRKTDKEQWSRWQRRRPDVETVC